MKTILSLAVTLCLAASLVACGGNTPAENGDKNTTAAVTTAPQAEAKKDPAEVCAGILSGVTFYETPEAIDADMLPALLGDLFTGRTVSMYAGSRACADTLVAVALSGTDDAAVVKALENYVHKQQLAFEDYKPSEMTKIQNAVIRQGSGVAVLCITDDYANAAAQIEALLK